MQESPLLKNSMDIEEELALIKAKLKSNESKLSESDLQLSGIYEDQDLNRISNLSSSLIDLKISEINQRLYPHLADPERCRTLEKLLKEKEQTIQAFQAHEKELISQLDDLSDQINQYEVDFHYLINQNQLANQHIKELKLLLEAKAGREENIYLNQKSKPNYKLYSELELANDENSRLVKELDLAQDLKDEYENKLKEAELKYEELLNEITSLKKSNLSCYDERLVETATVEFYRKVVLGLESEIKELRSENEFFKVKNAELESLMKRNTQESSFMKELIQELGVASEKDLYKKVLFLAEVAKQSKEIRQFVQKVSTIITKKSGKKDLNLKEITNYIQNKLT